MAGHLPEHKCRGLRRAWRRMLPQPVTARAATLAGLCATVALAGLLPDARSAAQQQVRAAGPCSHVRFSRRPSWSTSATWNGTDELVVIDQLYNRILRYSATGESLGSTEDVAETALERFFPLTVKARDSGLIFQFRWQRLRAVDHDYVPLPGGESFFGDYGPEGRLPTRAVTRTEVDSLWLWQPVGKGEIVAFSDLTLAHPTRERVGFVRFKAADPGEAKVLGKDVREEREALPYDPSSPPCPASCSPGTALRTYNRLGHQYIAALGETAYVLRMDDLKIYRQEGAHATFEPLPVSFVAVTQPGVERPPALPRLYSKQDFVDVMATVELSTMPTGLYAWRDARGEEALFVITRTYDVSGTHWTVTKLDPKSHRIMGTASIPTNANHLVVAPGPKRWAFIEKGPVRGWKAAGAQEIPGALFVDADRFAGELRGDLCGK